MNVVRTIAGQRERLEGNRENCDVLAATLLTVAARVGSSRLIDNRVLGGKK